MLKVEDWAEIGRLHRGEQMPIKAIARHLGISKNTVKRALASGEPPPPSRAGPGPSGTGVRVPSGDFRCGPDQRQ